MIIHKNELFSAMIKKWYLILVVCSFFACQKDDGSSPTPNDDSLQGFWEIPEKGWVFEFKEGSDVFYNLNTAGCSIQDADFNPIDFNGFIITQISDNEMIGTSDLSDSDVLFTRLLNQNPTCLPNQISITEDPIVNFDHFWNIFNDYYAFFEARTIDWSQYESLRNQVTEANFYDTLETLAYVLDDGHVSIVDENSGIQIESGNPRLYERLNANLSGDLIIENDGGYDTAALDMVSRFIDQERVSYYKKARLGNSFTENKSFSVAPKGNFQFTDNIVLLTSPFTISAAELFTLCLKDLPYITIVGENTNGAFSTILTHVLPNGAEVGLSNEIYSDANGLVFEEVGIGPENQVNQVPFLSTSDFEEEKDSGIDRALEILNN